MSHEDDHQVSRAVKPYTYKELNVSKFELQLHREIAKAYAAKQKQASQKPKAPCEPYFPVINVKACGSFSFCARCY